MTSGPKVSVMVVCYNHAHFIRDTLESVLGQDYDNLQIVVADDASTDGTQEIAKEYAARYPDRFVLRLNERNLGITGNCNIAFSACTGEFISTFAGDDLFLPGKISAQVEEFLKDPEVVLCYHPVEMFDSETNKTIYFTDQNPRDAIYNVDDLIMRGGFQGPCSVMVKKSACPPGGFDSRLPSASDWLFEIEVALQGKIAKLDRIYGRYRKHSQSTTRRSFEMLEESLCALDLVLEKHPERPELVELCRKGKARYIFGEAFRQLGDNPQMAHRLAGRALALAPRDLRYRILFMLSAWAPIANLAGPTLNKGKYFLKKYLA